MSYTKRMPQVGARPTSGWVTKIHRLPGHYVSDGEPVLDVAVAADVLTALASEGGKVLTCRMVGEVVSPGDELFEVTTVGTPTWELFIAYRRADSIGHAGRLGDRLVKDFGPGQVFKDIESLPLGVDFVEHVRSMLMRAAAMVVVIGPQWLTLTDAGGPRIQNLDDLHREEIRTALTRRIPVFPALINSAVMPREEDLPDDIQALARRQAIEISDLRWDYDMGRLSAAVAQALTASPRRRAFLEQLKTRQAGSPVQWITDDPMG